MMKKKFSKILGLCSFLMVTAIGCNADEKLPTLGDKLAGAVDIAKSPSGNLFYVLNSDYERKYDKGSIVVIDPDAAPGAQKVTAMGTPRMGRSISVAQGLMLVTYADPEALPKGTVQMWDVADERDPKLISTMEIACSPMNGILSSTQPYFAVGCIGGNVFMGKNPKNSPEAPITLELVRAYGYEHHALYFYETGGKTFLLGFPTDIDTQDFADTTLEDRQTYDLASDSMIDGANGVPDNFENTVSARRRWQLSAPYQMFIYPVTDEEAASKGPQADGTPAYTNFRFIDRGTFTKPSQSEKEQRFVYYNLLEADGQGSAAEQIVTPFQHRYRSNFWDAKTGPENNPSIFYLSQRGDYGSESNNILRVVINDAALLNYSTSVFEQIFQANRVYGFAIDRDNRGRYPGSFDIANVAGQKVLLLNSFRDLYYFANAPFYSITRKLLDNPDADHEIPSSRDSTDFNLSFYQVAISNSGKALTSSFYGNALYLFDASPGASIRDQTPVRID